MIDRNNPEYLDLFLSSNLSSLTSLTATSGVTALFPMHPVYKDKVEQLYRKLTEYLADETLKKPFNCLILGPPGTGKSHLVSHLEKSLADEVKTRARYKKTVYQRINLSELKSLDELRSIFQNILRNSQKRTFTLTFFDEFDIRWQGASVLKHLINPMESGEFWSEGKFRVFGKAAFFFAGSYLQDIDTLARIERPRPNINLNRVLWDLFLSLRKRNNEHAIKEITDLQDFCYKHELWAEQAEPVRDIVTYLRSLDKLNDFLSRIGENRFELPDLSAPLSVTVEEFVIEGCQEVTQRKVRGREIFEFVALHEERSERFEEYNVSYQPLIKYKNVLLCERLARVAALIERRFQESFGVKSIKIDRRMLNYLTVVPVVHGMRSVAFMVDSLKVDGNTIKIQDLPLTLRESHIQDAGRYAGAGQVWEMLKVSNPLWKGKLEKLGEGWMIVISKYLSKQQKRLEHV